MLPKPPTIRRLPNDLEPPNGREQNFGPKESKLDPYDVGHSAKHEVCLNPSCCIFHDGASGRNLSWATTQMLPLLQSLNISKTRFLKSSSWLLRLACNDQSPWRNMLLKILQMLVQTYTLEARMDSMGLILAWLWEISTRCSFSGNEMPTSSITEGPLSLQWAQNRLNCIDTYKQTVT